MKQDFPSKGATRGLFQPFEKMIRYSISSNGESMKIIISTLLVLSLTACSSTKSILQIVGLDRVDIHQKDYEKPDFYLGDYKSSSRKPASIAKKVEVDKSISNRQLYFLSSYSQYKILTSVLNEKDSLKACPSFHNLILEHKSLGEVSSEQYSLDVDFSEVKHDSKLASYYPILAVPYNKTHDLYSVLVKDDWKNSREHLTTALRNYYQTTKKEVVELCDKGVGPGYYVYENLVTYFKKDTGFHNTKDGLKALLKVPVLANMVILNNLQKKNLRIEKNNIYDQWLLSRTNAEWFESFMNQLKEKRNSKISSNYIKQ